MHLRDEWIKTWVERLYKDYDYLCFQFRLKLRPPLIKVEPSSSRWGLWDPVTRTITLSVRLIETYAWDVVLEVLKHEMAHQITDEIYGAKDAHGPLFRRACLGLGMAEWAMRAETDFADLGRLARREEPDEPTARLLSRIEKLLALATSSNEHEALLAMEKVQELYEKYQLDRLESAKKSDFVYRTISLQKRRIERFHYLIGSLLRDHFFVRVIFCSVFDPRDQCEYKALELMGTQESVQMAEYVYYFLKNQAHSLWNEYRRAHQKSGRSKNSYVIGVLSGFREKLERDRAERGKTSTKTGKALVLAANEALEKFVSYRYPRLTSVRRGTSLRDGSSYRDGVEEGWKLILKKGIETSEERSGKLLPRPK
jgi:Protein of unknown function (DUF2786)/SprT-like family